MEIFTIMQRVNHPPVVADVANYDDFKLQILLKN
jgi:hypothetical protein